MFFASGQIVHRVKRILSWTGGGVHKRIDENRELLELLQEEAPQLLDKHSEIIGWLMANDEFLNELRSAMPVTEGRFLAHAQSPGTNYPRQMPASAGQYQRSTA